jgi:hypothetical protein
MARSGRSDRRDAPDAILLFPERLQRLWKRLRRAAMNRT